MHSDPGPVSIRRSARPTCCDSPKSSGNTVVVKPASASPQSGCNLETAFREAGLPDGVFQIVVGDRTTATALIHSPVSVVSLTGSVRTGVYVAREASKDLKKVVLELGGSDPFIVAGGESPALAENVAAGRAGILSPPSLAT